MSFKPILKYNIIKYQLYGCGVFFSMIGIIILTKTWETNGSTVGKDISIEIAFQ